MLLGYQFAIKTYKGRVMATIPFVPVNFMGLRGLVYSGLTNPSPSDAGAIFLYTLITMGLRPTLLKLANLEVPRFDVPSLDKQS